MHAWNLHSRCSWGAGMHASCRPCFFCHPLKHASTVGPQDAQGAVLRVAVLPAEQLYLGGLPCSMEERVPRCGMGWPLHGVWSHSADQDSRLHKQRHHEQGKLCIFSLAGAKHQGLNTNVHLPCRASGCDQRAAAVCSVRPLLPERHCSAAAGSSSPQVKLAAGGCLSQGMTCPCRLRVLPTSLTSALSPC